MIWSVPDCAQLMLFRFTLEPALALAFSVSRPSLLAIAERADRVHLIGAQFLAQPCSLRQQTPWVAEAAAWGFQQEA